MTRSCKAPGLQMCQFGAQFGTSNLYLAYFPEHRCPPETVER